MRDQLSDYLSTLERNTDAVNAWLDANRADILLANHRLTRAISQDKNAQEAMRLIKEMGDAAGFVLGLQDFRALATTALGQGAQDLDALIAATPAGLPARILEKLPDLRAPSAAEMAAPVVAPATLSDEEREAARAKWWNPGSWFGKSEEQLQAEAQAESARKIADIKRHWGLVKAELISLQSERHYYIDSFMDWIADTMQPEGTPKSEADAAREMLTYQNPQRVIDLAHEDYGRVVHGKAQALCAQARAYCTLAACIDEQDIETFAEKLPALFPVADTPESLLTRTLLLKDFGVASFAELALERVKNREDQMILLKAALALEPAFTLSGASSPADVFERIVTETTAKDPLGTAALAFTLDALKSADGYDEKQLYDIAMHPRAGKTVFERLTARYEDDMPRLHNAIDALMRGMNAQTLGDKHATPAADGLTLTQFLTANRTQDASLMRVFLNNVSRAQNGRGFMALLELSCPNVSVAQALEHVAKGDAKTLAQLTDAALDAGLLDAFRFNIGAAKINTSAFAAFFEKNVLPAADAFPLPSARRLIAATYANGGLDDLRKNLTRAGGWLEQAASGGAQKMPWIAALLEPFDGDIAKSNILAQAASAAHDAAAARALSSLESNFSGTAVRLADDKLMTNIENIANIWYSADAKAMHYTVNGTDHVFMEDVSAPAAKEFLRHMLRKGDFCAEYDGLFRSENIDRITTDAQGTRAAWHRHSGSLNVEDAYLGALHVRADFAHIRQDGGRVQSINQNSITLLQPLEDGSWLLVDRYGSVELLEGKMDIVPHPPMLDVGGAYFNPANASVISLDAQNRKIDFRVESRDFDALVARAAQGEYFYGVDVPASMPMADIENAVKDVCGDAVSSMHFNVKTLGYMMFAGGAEAGFASHKFGAGKKQGFISTDEKLAEDIFDALAPRAGIISAANLLAHKDRIDDAYYNADKGVFYMVVGGDLLQTPCAQDEAHAALQKLAAEKGYMVAGANAVVSPAGGTQDLPADVVNLNAATLIFAAPAQDRTFIVCANEKFHINLDGTQAEALIDELCAQSLQEAKAATPTDLVWTQGLRSALCALPRIEVPVTPCASAATKKDMFDEALGRARKSKPLPAALADFSIAAAAPEKKLTAGQALVYPPRRPRALKFG